jgi:hypothetical protein
MSIYEFEMLAGGMPAPLIKVEIGRKPRMGLWLDLPEVYTTFGPDCKDGIGRKGGKTYVCSLENGQHTQESRLLAENAKIWLLGVCERAETSFGSVVPANYAEIIASASEIVDVDPEYPVDYIYEDNENPRFTAWVKDAVNNGVDAAEIMLRAKSRFNYTWDGEL